jgi:hypothetical protein
VLAETGTKRCPKCEEVKSLSSFNKNKTRKDGHQNTCKTCQRLYHKEYRQNNRDRELQRCKEYRQNNPDKVSQWQKEYYQNNQGRILQRRKEHHQVNRGRILQRHKEYHQNNRDKARAKSARKRAAKRNATPPWADKAVIEAIYAEALWFQDFTCEPYHVDHIVPLKSDFVCGLHVPANLQTLPGAENIAKSNRSWPEQLPCQTRRGIDHQWWKELYARTIALEK